MLDNRPHSTKEPLHKAHCVTLSSPKNQIKTVGLLESCWSEWVPVPGFLGILRKLRMTTWLAQRFPN
jgi:hypothetical protein